MSSFLCSDIHIASIAAFAALDMKLDMLKTARGLRRLNNSSMKARYGDSPVAFGGTTVDSIGKYAAARINYAMSQGVDKLAGFDNRAQRAAFTYALCACLEYQCAEAAQNHPGRKILTRIQNAARNAAGSTVSHVWSI